MFAECAGGYPDDSHHEGGLAMSATEQWVVPVILAAWIVVLLSGFLVLG